MAGIIGSGIANPTDVLKVLPSFGVVVG